MKSLLKKLFPNSRFVHFEAFVPLTPDLAVGPPLLLEAMKSGDLGTFLNVVFKIAISAGAILAVLRIGYAGFRYMTTDAMGGKKDSIKMIQDAVIGLLLLLAIIIILERINPKLLNMNFQLGPTGTAPTQQSGGLPLAN